MTIPEYPALMQPVLHALKESSRDTRFVPLMKAVGTRLGLTAEEMSARLPSGTDTVFGNRLQWALTYLERAGSVEERQGRWHLVGTERKRAPVSSSGTTQGAFAPVAAPNPDGVIAASARLIHQRLARELLGRIHGEPPELFEHLMIELLHTIGYGCRPDLSRHLGRSGDGGLDGAVPQDVLGLDVIYIQAKRYRPGSTVPVSAVREFAGSLDGRKASKGVFVTTAAFPRSAASFVSAVPSKIALIDGQALADLLIRYDIGVKVCETYKVKQIDEIRLAAALHRSKSRGEH